MRSNRHPRPSGHRLVIVLAVVVVLLLTVGGGVTWSWQHVSAADCPVAGAPLIHFQASDGARLDAVVLGHGRAAAVLVHQSNQSRCAWVPFARHLAGLGFVAMAVDFPLPLLGEAHWDRYLAAVVGYLRRGGSASVVLVGASLGGAAAMVASAEVTPPVDGVVDLSGERRVRGLDADGALGRSTVPLLVIASADDSDLDARDAAALYRESAARDRRLEVLSGSAHGMDILAGPDGPRMIDLIVAFVRAHSARADGDLKRWTRAGGARG
jgi:pimeloyl-ACP methyl ester carboxylesterase